MASASPRPGDLLGHFRLIEQIGEGGMGIVYRARDERLQRDVAVKVLNAKTLGDLTAKTRFRREALTLSRLNHPNVEAVYDFHSEQGLDYLVLEYVPGVSLDDRLHQGALPESEAVSLGVQLARGLAAAHARGVLHRDLKPGNLRVTPEHILKILDFGLAQLFGPLDERTLDEAETVTIEVVGVAGTPPYMAPEQLANKEPDVRTDIYSAGAVLYELVTGARAFPQQGQALGEAIQHSSPPAPTTVKKDISPEIEAIILKCLQKDPNVRYQSAGELLGDLARVRSGQITTESSQNSAVQLATKSRNRWIGVNLAAVLLVGITSGILIWKWPKPPQVRQKIMAMLPIDTVGQDPATSALGLGLTDTVTAKLVQASDNDSIQVVSPRDLRDKGVKTAEDARREFGTDLVLESSLQRSGQTIRINCYLVDSKTHRQLAAKTIEAQVTDAFGLQDRVLSAALDMLPSQFSPERRSKLNVQQDTKPAAYEAYIRGQGYLQEYEKPESIEDAIAEFNKALKIDPNYAPAYAGLGKAYLTGFQPFLRGEEWAVNASRACQKALSLNPHLVEGHICLGSLFNATGKYDKAVEEFQRAAESEASSEDALRGLADAYTNLGDFGNAESTYKKAIALRPNYWGVYSWLGFFYYTQARYADAAEMFRKAAEVAPENYHNYFNLGAMYTAEGRYADAIKSLQRSLDLRPNLNAYGNLGYVYFLMHRFPDAVDALAQAVKFDGSESEVWGNLGDALYWSPDRRAESSRAYKTAISLALKKVEINPRDADTLAYLADYFSMIGDKKSAFAYQRRALKLAPSDPEVLFRSSLAYNHFGETEHTLEMLKKAVEERYSRTIIRDVPDFGALREDPRFQAVINGA